jgi:TRAP-type transport system small permease protein
VRSLIDRLSRWAENLAIIMLIAVTSLITAQILAREVFVDGAPWADELARFCGLGLIFLGIPSLLRSGQHVRVDLLLNAMPAGRRRYADWINEALTVAFCALYLVSGGLFLQRAGRFSSPSLAIPNLIYYLPAVLGMALMMLVALERLSRLSRTLRNSAAGSGASSGGSDP